MKTFNTYYKSQEDLKSFILDKNIEDSESLLIQVFTSTNDETFISELINFFKIILPKSYLIGSTTDGEIMNDKVSVMKTVISFTSFEKTTLKVFLSDAFGSYLNIGKKAQLKELSKAI